MLPPLKPGSLVKVLSLKGSPHGIGMTIEEAAWEASPDPRVPDVLHRRVGWKVLVDGRVENIETYLLKKLDNS